MNIDQETLETFLPNEILSPENTIEEKSTHANLFVDQDDLRAFFDLFEQIKSVEEKITTAIAFMQKRLTGFASPKFREFWEVRKLCLPFFKEELSPKSRAELWQQYVDLAVEARRIKEILDEKSSFAYEQIDLALQSLENDLNSKEESLLQVPALEIPVELKSLLAKKESYRSIQRELYFFNTLATKINALRKEVIKTDMRIRSKNKLFEKLSQCGDRIFPRRKELIKKVSDDFLQDVGRFFDQHFAARKVPNESLFSLREEVKGLQTIAKILTLNTYAFTEARLKLSSCWDLLKEWEKEKKKEILEKKAEYQQAFDIFSPKIEEFERLCQQDICFEEVNSKYRELSQELQKLQLGRADAKALKEKMETAKKPHADKRQSELLEIQEKEKQQEVVRFQKAQDFKNALTALVEKADSFSFENLSSEKASLEETVKSIAFSKAEKVLIDRLFKQLKDKVLDVKGKSLLALSHDKREQYEGLKQILEEKKQRRQEVKSQMELYRKLLGGSSLSFEKAITCQEMLEVEKESLEKINHAILTIEEKMEQIQ